VSLDVYRFNHKPPQVEADIYNFKLLINVSILLMFIIHTMMLSTQANIASRQGDVGGRDDT
jgi:hypothetical protein